MNTQLEDVEIGGYAPNSGPDVADDIKDRSARRWFFNPAARIDVRDRVTGNEIVDGEIAARSFIKAGTLTSIQNTTFNSPRPKDQPPPPGSKPEHQRLVAHTKYARDIADELAYAYADTGAITIESLTGIEDEQLVRSIFRLCVGPQIKVATDPMLPGEKVPVLPAMLGQLNVEAPARIERAFEGKNDPKFRQIVEETRRLLVASCEMAHAGWARALTEESKQSIADRAGGHPGKAKFDRRDRRAFAALGESIPTDIQPTSPTLEKAVELLLKKELQAPAEDPRIAMMEKALAEQKAQIESLVAGQKQTARKPAAGA